MRHRRLAKEVASTSSDFKQHVPPPPNFGAIIRLRFSLQPTPFSCRLTRPARMPMPRTQWQPTRPPLLAPGRIPKFDAKSE
jgi:hypothetical protein